MKIDGKVYGYAPKEKFIKMKTGYEQHLNLEKENELLEKKIDNKNDIIETKTEIIKEWKQHAKFMDQSFDKFDFSKSKTQRVLDKVVDIALPIGTFIMGAKFGSESN
jgi:hypothetical protein